MSETRYVERAIIHKLVDALLAADFNISVYDGEDYPVAHSRDKEQILKGMCATDEDILYVYKDGKQRGWVSLFYGNGAGVIHDYTTNLETAVKPAFDLADEIDCLTSVV